MSHIYALIVINPAVTLNNTQRDQINQALASLPVNPRF
jgi:hypothetical protein